MRETPRQRGREIDTEVSSVFEEIMGKNFAKLSKSIDSSNEPV